MKTRVAVLSVIVDNPDSVGSLNAILHEARAYVIGRMGLPYEKRNISIISLVLDAPQDVIDSLAARVDALDGVNAKVTVSSYEFDAE